MLHAIGPRPLVLPAPVTAGVERVVSSAEILPFRPHPSRPTDSKGEKLDSSNLKILISDDDSLARMALIDLLGEYLLLGTHNFLEAFNLQSALMVFERQQKNIRAILTDIDMPEKYAGLRLHQELRHSLGFSGPIALMSGRPAEEPAIAAVLDEDPETRFFPKPLDDIPAIGEWLRRGWS